MDLRNLPVDLLERVGRFPITIADREIPRETLRSVPSWGVSVLLHALALLILAILIKHGGTADADAEREFTANLGPVPEIADVTSLVEADRAGDPFTNLDSLDPPSLGLEPSDPLMRLSSQPEIAGLVDFSPELAGPKSLTELGASLSAGVELPNLADRITAPFMGRSGLDRAELVRREGGTVQSEEAVEKGLNWIVRHQTADGSWVLNVHEVCQVCPDQRTIDSRTGATGLALLPLLGAGYIHTVKSRHQAAVKRGLDWLLAHQGEDGDLFVGGGGTAHMYSHAIAAMAVCEAYGLSRDPKLKDPAQRAINFIVAAQDPTTGGWRYNPGQRGDTSVFGWQLFALRSADLAGLPIPRSTLQGCSKFLNLAAADLKGITYAYQPNGPPTAVMTAEGLVSRQLLGWPRKHPPLVEGARRVAADLGSSKQRNIYYWYYATQLLHNLKNKDWGRWNPRVREALIATQVTTDSCENGSWDPFAPARDRWGASGGRLYQTSLSVLTLEVYYRYLPLYRTADREGLEASAEARKAK